MANGSIGIDRPAVNTAFMLQRVVSAVIRVRETIERLACVANLQPLALFLLDLTRFVRGPQDFLVQIGVHRIGTGKRRVAADHLFDSRRRLRAVERGTIGEGGGRNGKQQGSNGYGFHVAHSSSEKLTNFVA